MKKKLLLSGFLGSLLLVSLIVYASPVSAQNNPSVEKPQLEYAFGKIPGKDIIVHVAVIVPPGFDKNEVIDNALKYQGAKRIENSEYSLINSLKWSSPNNGGIPVDIKYNDQNEPQYLNGAGNQIFEDALREWNDVPNTSAIFSTGLTTTTCPSLAKECGSEADGENGFGWAQIKQPNTLGVTYWKTTSQYNLEVDVLLTTNKKTTWNTDDTDYDVFTVALHELGHVLGLAHSDTRQAVMYASYQHAVDNLYQDDICGAQDLFGTQDTACSSNTSGNGDVSEILVTFQPLRNGLKVVLDLEDDSNNPVDAKVKITLLEYDNAEDATGTPVGTGTASSEDGSVSFIKRGNPSGCYSVEVNEIDDSTYGGTTTFTQEKPYCN